MCEPGGVSGIPAVRRVGLARRLGTNVLAVTERGGASVVAIGPVAVLPRGTLGGVLKLTMASTSPDDLPRGLVMSPLGVAEETRICLA
jgi:hypothetical protein